MARIKTHKNISKKDLILKKAAGLFRQKGFSGSTMRELAEEVGVEAPSLYNHIGSKTELLQAICFNVADAFNQHLALVDKTDVGFSKKLEEVIRFHVQMMQNGFDEVYVANHEWKHLDEPFFSDYLQQRKKYESVLMAWLEKGMLQMEFKPLDARITVLTILSALRGLEFWFRQKQQSSTLDIEQNMITQLLNGINR